MEGTEQSEGGGNALFISSCSWMGRADCRYPPSPAGETEARSSPVSAGGGPGRVHPPPQGMEKSRGPGAGSWWLLRPPRRPLVQGAMARKQWAVNSQRVARLCRAMLRRGGKGRETGQRRNQTPVRRGSGTHVLPAAIELPVGPPCAAVPRFPPARRRGCSVPLPGRVCLGFAMGGGGGDRGWAGKHRTSFPGLAGTVCSGNL